MMTQLAIRALLAHDESVPAELVSDHILPDSGVSLVEVSDILYPVPETIRASDADVLIVGCAEGSDDALRLIDWWTASRPGLPVVVACQDSSNGFVEEVFTAGADDMLVLEPGPFVSPAAARQVAFSLQKAGARKVTPGEHDEVNGKLIAVLGPKGGIGKTITACNLALALTTRGKRTVLVDLALQFGDVALSLGLTPDTTVYDLAV